MDQAYIKATKVLDQSLLASLSGQNFWQKYLGFQWHFDTAKLIQKHCQHPIQEPSWQGHFQSHAPFVFPETTFFEAKLERQRHSTIAIWWRCIILSLAFHLFWWFYSIVWYAILWHSMLWYVYGIQFVCVCYGMLFQTILYHGMVCYDMIYYGILLYIMV